MKKATLSLWIIFYALICQSQDNWITYKNYPTLINIDLQKITETRDTPFVVRNKQGETSNYLLPVKFTPNQHNGLRAVNIIIKSIGASYDTKDRLMVYFRGKIDMSCCYPAPVFLEFYDELGTLIQKSTTDHFGNFKIKSINGNIVDISNGQIKFNFNKVKTFDANADIRFARLDIYKKPIDTDLLDNKTTVSNHTN